MSDFPKVKFGALCDDVRREDNGKLIFLGVYGENVLVANFPALLRVATPVWFEVKETYNGNIWTQVLLDETRITEVAGHIEIGAGNPVIAIQPIPIQVPREGTLSFQLKFSEAGEWQTTLKIPIRPNPSANVSPPPS